MKVRTFIGWLVSLRVVVVCLGLLMVLVWWGTLYQVEHGLWAAQQRFFYSWVVMIYGIVPFPGTQLILSVLFVNLTVAMLLRFVLGWRSAGIILIHLGLMLMLAGGWVTRQFGEESYLALVEGEGSNLTASYREWELSIWRETETVREITGLDAGLLLDGLTIDVKDEELKVAVEAYHPNCRGLISGEGVSQTDRVNASGIKELDARPRNRDPEMNSPGLLGEVIDIAGDRYPFLLFGGETRPTRIEASDGPVFLNLRRKRYPLPVFIRLTDFRKEFHPHTRTPKHFASLIEVHVGDVVRDVIVQMNEPFRFRSYTFYQASYGDLEGGVELSKFAVTRNVGRLLPYIATGMTVVGLIAHFLISLVRWRPRDL